MIRYFRLLPCVLIAIAISLGTKVEANESQCGERVDVNDVLVVDMEEFVNQETLFFEKLQEQAGDFTIMTQAPFPVNLSGSKATAINNAKKFAAHEGCDLLVLLGLRVIETRWQGRVTTVRSLMTHLGKREDP